MRRALALSRKALGQTQPNPLVGAIVLDAQGRCVGTGIHEKAGSDHAEICALREASNRAKGGTLYVTLEPCTHQGRTPPCSDRILRSGLARVVIASRDPNPHVQGGGVEVLQTAGLDVQSGCLEALSHSLNEPYFHFVRNGRPFVTAKVALSLDGRIGAEGMRVALSGPACVSTTMKLRGEAGAILVGVNTILADDPHLNVRGRFSHRSPIRAIVDPHLRTHPNAQIFSEAGGPITIFCREEALSKSHAKDLENQGARLHALDANASGNLQLEELLNYFNSIDVTSVLVEGGAKLLTRLAAAGLIDRWVLYLTPQILGPAWKGHPTIPLLGSGPFPLHIRSVIRRGDDWQILALPK